MSAPINLGSDFLRSFPRLIGRNNQQMEETMTAIRIPNTGSHVTQIDALILAIDLRTEIDHGLKPSREKQRRLKHLLLILAGKGGLK